MTANGPLHIITGEFPPQPGGVSDYTKRVAERLAEQGEEVHVWCPGHAPSTEEADGIWIHRSLGYIGPADLFRAGRALDVSSGPKRLLVQWVPHGFGFRSLNLAFCFWLFARRLRGDEIEVMVHEPYLPFSRTSWRQSAAALVHRLMTIVLLAAAKRIWVSIPGWEQRLRPYMLGRRTPLAWLPVPSNVACIANPAVTAQVRRQFGSQILLGHFGTFGKEITRLLEPVIANVLSQDGNRSFVLIGRGSQQFRAQFVKRFPLLEHRVHATGALEEAALSAHLNACDVFVQPYPDGVSTRRTTAMAILSHGRAMITTSGELTESFWEASRASALSEPTAPRISAAVEWMIENPEHRHALEQAARSFYRTHFGWEKTALSLRQVRSPKASLLCV